MKIHRSLLIAAGTALFASTAAAAEEAQPQICGGMLGLECNAKHFCHYSMTAECGAGDQTGVCKAIPDMCASMIDPVCACNGETFQNECEANMKGFSVASKGECGKPGSGGILDGGILDGGGLFPKPSEPEPEPEPPATGTGTSTTVCGGRGGPQCAAGYVCIYPVESECGAADAPGKCEPTGGMMCTTEYKPICGCDGKTYSNACVAQYQHGVSVKAEGECPKEGGLLDGGILKPPANEGPIDVGGTDNSGSSGGGLFEPRKCGGASKRLCPLAQYCKLPEGACTTGSLSPEGTCASAPLTCNDHTLPSVTQVCGCDGQTYRTECHAQKAGVSVLYRGACFSKAAAAANEQANPRICGGKGLLAKRCSADAGEFCEYEVGVCGLYDAAGSCTAKPEVCSADVDPVCSCSGKSYTNACEARRAGESIKSLGNCPNLIHTIDDGIGGGLSGLASGAKLDILASNSTSGMCNPREGMPCPEGYYCIFETGKCLGAQEMGICVVQPAACTPSSESTQVCGCSGSTFATKCDAAMAGESLVTESSCLALTSPAATGPVRGGSLLSTVAVAAGALVLAGLVA